MDIYYLVLVLPAVVFALWASANVNGTFEKYNKQLSVRHMTGADAARAVLDANGLQGVRIDRVSGKLTDHYDPRDNVIRLSDSTYASTSTAAIGVAAHEAGHAIQYAQDFAPVKLRAAIIPVTNIGSRLSFPLIFIGLILMGLEAISPVGSVFVWIGVICFGLTTLFQLVTLPTEFDASRRAIGAIENTGVLTSEELVGAKKVLRAAALTYVAALAVSLMQLIRLIAIAGRGKRR